MASMFMSTLMMFFPRGTQWFCLIGLWIFFFGIYIPYDKYKKKKKAEEKKNPKPIRREPVKKPIGGKKVEQLDILKEASLLTEEEYRERLHKL